MSNQQDWPGAADGSRGPGSGKRTVGRIGSMLLLLAIAAVIGIVGFGYSLMQSQTVGETASTDPDTVLFPDLQAIPAAGTTLVIGADASRFSLVRRDDGWRLADWDEYPADSGKVEHLLRELSAMRGTRVAEGGTAGGGASTQDPLATAIPINIQGPDDNMVAAARIGAVVAAPGGAQITRTYIDRTSDNAVFLSDRPITLLADPLKWIDPVVLDIPRDRIQSVVTTDTEGKVLTIERQEQGGEFAPTEMPESGRISESWMMTRTAAALEKLQFSQVRSSESDMPEDGLPFAKYVFVTREGLRISLDMFRLEGGAWTQIAADTVDGATSNARAEASRIEARTDGWRFLLPEFMLGGLVTKTDEMIEQRPSGSSSSSPSAPAPQPTPETENPATPR